MNKKKLCRKYTYSFTNSVTLDIAHKSNYHEKKHYSPFRIHVVMKNK